MDFRSLTYFVTVAQELNITRAAEKLQMSQPPLSNQIRMLEEEVGAELFIRGKRHLQLTPAGRTLLRRAEQILDLGETAREEVQMVGNELSGRLRLGMVEGRAPYLMARWVAGFSEEYPLVTFSIWNGSSDEVIDQLYKGLVDLAVIAAPFDTEHLEGIGVGKEPWVAIIPAEHPLAKEEGNTIDLRKLGGLPLILPARRSRLASIRRWFASVGIEPQVLCTLSSYIDALALAEQNAGISIFPQTTYTPNPHVVTKIITNPPKMAEYMIVWEKARTPRGLTRDFIDYVRDFMEDDRIHSERFQVKEEVFPIPEDADLL